MRIAQPLSHDRCFAPEDEAGKAPSAMELLSNMPTYRAEDLCDGGIEARIVLGQQAYSLRITKAGKLILTK